jgi:signal peptidase I
MQTQPKCYSIVAFVLSLLVPGLGQVYAGKPVFGAVWFLSGLSGAYLAGLFGAAYTYKGLLIVMCFLLVVQMLAALDALRLAAKARFRSGRPYDKWYVYTGIIILVVMTWVMPSKYFFQLFGIRAFRILSWSMEPTLLVGDSITVKRNAYAKAKPSRGDVVSFPYPGDTTTIYIKRIVGLGGEKIEIKNKIVFINDKPLGEPYKVHRTHEIYPADANPRDNFGPITVPEGSVFVMGDNRDRSHDSRFLGCVKVKNIEGRALYIYYSNPEKSLMRVDKIRANRTGMVVK